jgi:3-hydroxybutyryl-CoA dehydrogenase
MNSNDARPFAPDDVVAVIGCGTMGAGIAQVAAVSGHPVCLFDVRPGAAQSATLEIGNQLKKLVTKGSMDAARSNAALARLRPIADLSEAASARLVIEAVQENLEVKQALFASLEGIVDSRAILASNTSSLSITSIAAGLKRPGQVCGLHFFNPAPVMPLVEVITGLATDEAVILTMMATARAWGKTPVRARSTPGFIVNRIARPYYAEAMRVLQEGAGDAATLDTVLRESGGFRLGPFEVMDLIGHDVNFAVTCSVHAGLFGDPRFTPSVVQRELVEAGRLGRKTGRGFYDYAAGAERPAPRVLPPMTPPARVQADGSLGPASCLLDMAAEAGIAVEQTGGLSGRLIVDGVQVVLTDGRSATVRAAAEGARDLVTFDLALDYKTCPRIALAAAEQAEASALGRAAAFFQALGKTVSPMADVPGMIVMRTVAMLVNGAADAVLNGVASAADIDVAMVKGTGYPLGPLAWADQTGPDLFLTAMNGLQESYGEDRYRASQYLRRIVARNGRFHSPRPDAGVS